MNYSKPLQPFDVDLFLRAVDFAAVKHRDQRRKGVDASPYINHPIRVAAMLADIGGIRSLPVLLAAILHDTIEDTCTTPEELATLAGPEVLGIVLEVTDDQRLPKTERKRLQIEHAPHMSRDAKLIKLADKCDNIMAVSENPPPDWSCERRMDYLDWAEKVVHGCRGTNRALEAYFDQNLKDAKKKLQLP